MTTRCCILTSFCPPSSIAGAPASGLRSQQSAPQQPAPLEAAAFRHQRRASFNGRLPPASKASGPGGGPSFTHSQSMPRASSGSFFGSGQGMAPSSGMQQLPPGRTAPQHRRSASSSGGDAPASLPGYHPAASGRQQWAHSNLNWCAEPYAVCQQTFVPMQLPMPAPQFMVRPVAPVGRPGQWGRQQSCEVPCEAAAWRPQMRPYQQPYMHAGGSFPSGGRYGTPTHSSGGGYGPASAPASTMSSPVLDRSRSRGPPGSVPPPPPLALPAVDVQVRVGGAALCRLCSLHLGCMCGGRAALLMPLRIPLLMPRLFPLLMMPLPAPPVHRCALHRCLT